jgi:hypothetical protein
LRFSIVFVFVGWWACPVLRCSAVARALPPSLAGHVCGKQTQRDRLTCEMWHGHTSDTSFRLCARSTPHSACTASCACCALLHVLQNAWERARVVCCRHTVCPLCSSRICTCLSLPCSVRRDTRSISHSRQTRQVRRDKCKGPQRQTCQTETRRVRRHPHRGHPHCSCHCSCVTALFSARVSTFA